MAAVKVLRDVQEVCLAGKLVVHFYDGNVFKLEKRKGAYNTFNNYGPDKKNKTKSVLQQLAVLVRPWLSIAKVGRSILCCTCSRPTSLAKALIRTARVSLAN